MEYNIIKQIGSGGQGMTPKQKEDLAGLLSRMAEIEAIFQGMDAADYEALKDTAEVKAGLTTLINRVNDIDNPSVHHIFMGDYGVTSLSDIEAAITGGKIVIMRAGAGDGMFLFSHMDYSYDQNGEYVFVALTPGNIAWFNLGSLRGYSTIQSLEVQSKLVSGTNIKTINGESILGAGNVNFAKYKDTLISSDAITCETTETVEGVSVYCSNADYYLQPNQKIVFADTVGDNTLYIINYDDLNNPFIISSGKNSISWNNFTNNDVRIQLASSSNVGQILSASRYWRGTDDVFIAEYGVTTHQQVLDAYNAGKVVVVVYNTRLYFCVRKDVSNDLMFTYVEGSNTYRIILSSNGWGSASNVILEETQNKATDFTTLNDTKYPSTQAVADYVSAIVGNINTILDTI